MRLTRPRALLSIHRLSSPLYADSMRATSLTGLANWSINADDASLHMSTGSSPATSTRGLNSERTACGDMDRPQEPFRVTSRTMLSA